jgi:hypothetical protein
MSLEEYRCRSGEKSGVGLLALSVLFAAACAENNPTKPAVSAEVTQATFLHGPPAHTETAVAKHFQARAQAVGDAAELRVVQGAAHFELIAPATSSLLTPGS